MADYWVTFRIESDGSYQTRYQSMLNAMIKARGQQASWGEPTSFWLVQSGLAIDAFARQLTAGLKSTKDLLVVRQLAVDDSVYFGKTEHLGILKIFLPKIRKLG